MSARVSGDDKGNLTEGNKATSVKITDTESKLNYFDANNDGIVDEDELKFAAEDSMRAKELNKLFKQIIFALIILVFVLVGSLTFMTITVVELSKDSEVDDNGSRSVLRTKGSDAPVITGLPVSDGSSVDQNRFDEDLLNEVNTTLTDFQNRRRLTAAPFLNTSYWYMSGTLSRDLTLDACGLLRDGHSTYTTRLSEVVVDPLDATEINFLTMHKVDIKGATGCDGLSRLIVYFNVDDEPVEVKCPLDITKDTCGMYRPGITFTNSSSTFTNDTAVYGGDDRRRLLLDEDFTLEEGMVDYENGWDSELNSHRRLGPSILYMYGDPVCFLNYYPSGAYYKWCSVPYLSTAEYYLNRYGAGWAVSVLEYWLRAFGLYGGNYKICVSGYNIYGWAKVVDTCKCKDSCSCFPSHATIEVEGHDGAVRMDELKYGDMVKSIDTATGNTEFKPVYLFGHADHESEITYVNVQAGNHTLQLSPEHFAVRCLANCDEEGIQRSNFELEQIFAQDVKVGDVMLVVDEKGHRAFHPVTDMWNTMERGLFNPYVRGGHIVVNGVVASVHSLWLFAGIPYIEKWLPMLYEAILYPVYVLFRAIGPSRAEWLAGALGVHSQESPSMDFARLGLVYILIAAAPIYAGGVAIRSLKRAP